jgi:hypothetical protein
MLGFRGKRYFLCGYHDLFQLSEDTYLPKAAFYSRMVVQDGALSTKIERDPVFLKKFL